MAKKDKKLAAAPKESASEAISKKFKQNPGIYIGSVVILVLVTITFIGGDFLSGGGFHTGQDFVFGYYDNVPISWVQGNKFAQSIEEVRPGIQARANAEGRNIDDLMVTAQIWRQAFERTAEHVAILHMVNKSKYKVPEKSVDRAVALMPQFQNNSGRFSSTLYNQMPESSRLALWRQTQEELTKIMFLRDFFSLMVPENEANFIAGMSSPMRSFDMISFRIDDYPESEFLAFAEENSSLFDSIHMSRIVITGSEREARRVHASIKDGTTTFEEAARVHSQDGFRDRGGDMGNRYLLELNREIPKPEDRDIVYSLGRGELSDVIQVSNGWAFFRVEDELTQANFNDFALMERVRAHVRSIERGRMEDWAIEQARLFSAAVMESGIVNALFWFNKDSRSFGPLPINYAGLELFTQLETFTASGIPQQELQAMSRNENFWRTAFSAPLNVPSEPLVQGNNILVFIPTEHSEADDYILENISMIYSSYWVNGITQQSMQYYFLGNGRMTDDNYFFNALRRYVLE
ncbi:MAG: SurA N-terminal domain-containing protein [Treponema sp.]|nr:SurA N-terminal domain-containing protein [Treponema sp.]